MSDPGTPLTDAELDETIMLATAEKLRRDRLNRRWTCLGCGWVMDYAYMVENDGEYFFDKDGCPNCEGAAAIEQIEAVKDG